jgi:ribosome biogenesis GTPase A
MSYTLDLEAVSRVSWYPGHMLKAQREIGEKLKLIDVVVIVVDARLPYTSWNSELLERIGSKPRIVWLNKQDLAEPEVTKEWVDWYRGQGVLTASGDCTASKTKGRILQLLKKAAQRRTGARARLRSACRAMIIGVPNVGKSSLINCLVGRPQAKTGPTPGVTRRQQWVPIGKDFELLDTPGVMVPRVADGVAGLRLGLIAAIKDRICGEDLLAKYLFHCWHERDR